MWHIQLLKDLAQKICKTDQNAAVSFIEVLFYLIKQDSFLADKLDVLALMGVIKDIYLFAKKNETKNISLAEFSIFCIGLLILHIKSSDDYIVENFDFASVIEDKNIFKALHRAGDGKNIHRLFSPQDWRDRIDDLDPVVILHHIERDVFAQLQFKVSVNLYQLAYMLSALLARQNDQFGVVSDLLLFLLPYEGLNSEFNELIYGIKDLHAELIKPNMKEICKKLELFVAFSEHRLVMKVASVIKQIKNNEFSNIHSIIERLNQLNSNNEDDELFSIIKSLKERYGYEDENECFSENRDDYSYSSNSS